MWLLQTPPEPPTPNYAVIYRDRVPDTGRTEGHVVVRSLSQQNEHREQICEEIAAIERLDLALFFSTDEAYLAYQTRPLLKRTLRDEEASRAAMRVGFVCRVTDGVFTQATEY